MPLLFWSLFMKSQHQRTLVLNADYTPIGLISWQKAITLDFKKVIRVVNFYEDDHILCSNGDHWPVPAVVALVQYKKPSKTEIPFSRKNVFLRDKLCCQYCGRKFKPNDLTYDHVIPRSKWDNKKRGTPTRWENIVSCCYKCNTQKDNLTLEEAGMKLIRIPIVPNSRGFIIGLAPWSKLQPEWLDYIPKHYKELLDVDES